MHWAKPPAKRIGTAIISDGRSPVGPELKEAVIRSIKLAKKLSKSMLISLLDRKDVETTVHHFDGILAVQNT
jgi:hypothetical protein